MSSEGSEFWRSLFRAVGDAGAYQAKRKAIEDALKKDWYTVPEAAAILDQHPKTIYERIRRREIIPSKPTPRKTRIHKNDLVNYLLKQAP